MSVIEKSQFMSAGEPAKALWISTVAFTLCFAVWTIFAIIGIRIKQDLGLNEAEFGLLVGTPVLTGSLVRIVLGIWTGRYGGRLVYTLTMLAAALATFLLSYAQTYTQMLIAGLGVGLAGGSFAVGVAYVSPFFPAEKQGTALGIFGAGNVGAAVTKFAAPFVLLAWGWQAVAEIWAVGLALMAIVFWFTTTDDPAFRLPAANAALSPRVSRRNSRRCRTFRSGASRSTISSPSEASSPCRCGCRAIWSASTASTWKPPAWSPPPIPSRAASSAPSAACCRIKRARAA